MASCHWDRRYLGLAKHVASWSKDPSTQVGAVLARPDKTIASLGFNGFPRGISDCEGRYKDRKWKWAAIVHAEANAILSCREPMYGYTLYVSPLIPCSDCAGLIVQSGISRVVSDAQDIDYWENMEIARRLLSEAGVEMDLVGTY